MPPRPFRLEPPRLSERDVVRACLDVLRYRGYRPERLHVGRYQTLDGRWQTHGEKGLPDYIAAHELYPAVYIEVKAPDGKLRPDQESKISELEIGFRLAVAVIHDVAQLKIWLDEHEQKIHQRWKQIIEKPQSH